MQRPAAIEGASNGNEIRMHIAQYAFIIRITNIFALQTFGAVQIFHIEYFRLICWLFHFWREENFISRNLFGNGANLAEYVIRNYVTKNDHKNCFCMYIFISTEHTLCLSNVQVHATIESFACLFAAFFGVLFTIHFGCLLLFTIKSYFSNDVTEIHHNSMQNFCRHAKLVRAKHSFNQLWFRSAIFTHLIGVL